MRPILLQERTLRTIIRNPKNGESQRTVARALLRWPHAGGPTLDAEALKTAYRDLLANPTGANCRLINAARRLFPNTLEGTHADQRSIHADFDHQLKHDLRVQRDPLGNPFDFDVDDLVSNVSLKRGIEIQCVECQNNEEAADLIAAIHKSDLDVDIKIRTLSYLATNRNVTNLKPVIEAMYVYESSPQFNSTMSIYLITHEGIADDADVVDFLISKNIGTQKLIGLLGCFCDSLSPQALDQLISKIANSQLPADTKKHLLGTLQSHPIFHGLDSFFAEFEELAPMNPIQHGQLMHLIITGEILEAAITKMKFPDETHRLIILRQLIGRVKITNLKALFDYLRTCTEIDANERFSLMYSLCGNPHLHTEWAPEIAAAIDDIFANQDLNRYHCLLRLANNPEILCLGEILSHMIAIPSIRAILRDHSFLSVLSGLLNQKHMDDAALCADNLQKIDSQDLLISLFDNPTLSADELVQACLASHFLRRRAHRLHYITERTPGQNGLLKLMAQRLRAREFR